MDCSVTFGVFVYVKGRCDRESCDCDGHRLYMYNAKSEFINEIINKNINDYRDIELTDLNDGLTVENLAFIDINLATSTNQVLIKKIRGPAYSIEHDDIESRLAFFETLGQIGNHLSQQEYDTYMGIRNMTITNKEKKEKNIMNYSIEFGVATYTKNRCYLNPCDIDNCEGHRLCMYNLPMSVMLEILDSNFDNHIPEISEATDAGFTAENLAFIDINLATSTNQTLLKKIRGPQYNIANDSLESRLAFYSTVLNIGKALVKRARDNLDAIVSDS